MANYGGAAPSFHERRLAERLADPEYLAEFIEATAELDPRIRPRRHIFFRFLSAIKPTPLRATATSPTKEGKPAWP